MTPNSQVARRLNEVADLLCDQGANSFRILAYRRGAETVAHLDRPVSEILEQHGLDALRQLPGIGDRLAIAIRDIVRFGRLPMLDRLRGEADAEEVLRTVPAIGRIHARRLHEELGIDSLETENATYRYVVRSTRIVGARDVQVLAPSVGDNLTLVTCYPFYYVGSAPKRFIVSARLVSTVNVTDAQ